MELFFIIIKSSGVLIACGGTFAIAKVIQIMKDHKNLQS